MDRYINFNGNLFPQEQPVFKAASRAARFGDGIFETMRMREGKILFEEHHSSRLFQGLQLLRFQLPTYFKWEFLREEIRKLVAPNDCGIHARVRLMVTRGEGGIMEDSVNSPQFLIECWPTENFSLNKEGMRLGVFEDCRKSMDKYSNVKSCNFLPSVMAALFAKKNELDEYLFLNSQNRICDATISNVFWIKNRQICTTALSEGGVAGVMRQQLLECLPRLGYSVNETTCKPEELLTADEVFLTNVIRGIRWVQSLGEAQYSNAQISKIFEEVIAPLQ